MPPAAQYEPDGLTRLVDMGPFCVEPRQREMTVATSLLEQSKGPASGVAYASSSSSSSSSSVPGEGQSKDKEKEKEQESLLSRLRSHLPVTVHLSWSSHVDIAPPTDGEDETAERPVSDQHGATIVYLEEREDLSAPPAGGKEQDAGRRQGEGGGKVKEEPDL